MSTITGQHKGYSKKKKKKKKKKMNFSECYKKVLSWAKRHQLPLGVAIVTLILDQLIKFFSRQLAIGEQVVLIPNWLWFTHVRNTGISFGMFQGSNTVLIIMSFCIAAWLIISRSVFLEKDNRAMQFAFFLIFAGLLGNLLDRVFLGSVVDMFNLGWWPVFNIADASICVAVGLIILGEVKELVNNR